MKNRVALTGVHTSTGVEPVNKQIKRHVEALLLDCHTRGYEWSDPEVIEPIAFAMNELPRHTTGGHTAYEMTFGELSQLTGEDISGDAYIQRLQENLTEIRNKVLELHRQEILRVKNQPESNQWQPTDLVFLQNNAQYNHGRRWLGPYEVVGQEKNDVTIRSLVDAETILEVPVVRLRAYHGDRDKAIELARIERGEHAINRIVSYRGDPMNRGTLGFNVEFEDGTVMEKTYSDIKRTVALSDLIKRHKELIPLTAETLKAQAELKRRIKMTEIPEKYRNAKEVYVEVRCRVIFSYQWYAEHFENLPDAATHLYLIRATTSGKHTPKSITATLQAENGFLGRPKRVPLDNWDYCTYVYTQEELQAQKYTIITQPPSHEDSGLTTDGVYHKQITPLEYDKPNMLTVLLLNVCSLRSAWQKGLLDYITNKPHDVLVLTETRLPADGWAETERAFKDLGYGYVGRTTTKTLGNTAGVLIATTRRQPDLMAAVEQPIDVTQDGRVLELALQFPPITIVAAYLPCYNTEVQGRSDYAPKYMKCFASKYVHALNNARERRREYLVCADLQVAMTDLDQTDNAVAEGSGSTTAERKALQELFTDSTYTDFYRMCNPTTRDFTSEAAHTQWTGQPNGTAVVGKRIDYILGSSNLHPESCYIDHTPLTNKITDHAAVIATIQYRRHHPPILAEYLASERIGFSKRPHIGSMWRLTGLALSIYLL